MTEAPDNACPMCRLGPAMSVAFNLPLRDDAECTHLRGKPGDPPLGKTLRFIPVTLESLRD